MDMNNPEWEAFSNKLMASRHKQAQKKYNIRKSALANLIRQVTREVFGDEKALKKQEKEYFACKEEDKFFQYNVLLLVRNTMSEIMPQVMEVACEKILAESMTHEFNSEIENARDEWRKNNPELIQKSIFDEDNEGAKFTLASR